MWESRTKDDLIIEVWEKLDCENVGADEIEAIMTAVEGQFGRAAVDSPMVVARLLADEGAELRHSEIMELYVSLAEDRPYDAVFRNLFRFENLAEARTTMRNLENLRKKFALENDREGLRLLRELAIGQKHALAIARNLPFAGEVAQWLTIWLQSPEIFDDWLELRRNSPEFLTRFGEK